jgi:hypothetical protein
MEHELQLILGRLETLTSKVKEGRAFADWLTRRELIRTLVKRVEVNQEHVNVIFRVGPTTPSTPSDHPTQSLHHCGGRVFATVSQYCFTWTRTGNHIGVSGSSSGRAMETNGGAIRR